MQKSKYLKRSKLTFLNISSSTFLSLSPSNPDFKMVVILKWTSNFVIYSCILMPIQVILKLSRSLFVFRRRTVHWVIQERKHAMMSKCTKTFRKWQKPSKSKIIILLRKWTFKAKLKIMVYTCKLIYRSSSKEKTHWNCNFDA